MKRSNNKPGGLVRCLGIIAIVCFFLPLPIHAQGRVIEIIADHDSLFKVVGQAKPVITVTAGESLLLRITANKAKTQNRDGSVHGFTLLRAGDRTRVPGWDFLLKPGTQEFSVVAPEQPGDYEALCTVICGPRHEQMKMKVVVIPKQP